MSVQPPVLDDTMECPLCVGKGQLRRTEVLERLGMKDFARVAQLSAEEAFRLEGNPVRDLSVYQSEWEQSFEFKFVKPDSLSSNERSIYERWKEIAELVGGVPKRVQELKVSETMRPDFLTGSETQGLWDPTSGTIIIKRSLLGSLSHFAGTLLHEVAHARTGYGDVSRELENELTQMLGTVAELHLV